MILKIALIYRALAAIAAGLLLSACQSAPKLPECTDPIGCVTIPPGEPIKLAVLQTLTGDSAVIGEDQLKTIELILSRRDYQLLGHPIALQRENELCTPEGGANAALRVIADPQVIAILGTTCSGAAKTASEIMSKAGLVMISSANTAPALTSVEGIQGDNWHPGYFRVIYNDAIAGRTAAEFAIKKLGIKKAATLDDGEFYGQQLTSVFAQVFEDLGGEVVLETSLNLDANDMTPFLEAIDNADAEFVFMPITASPATRILEQVSRFPNLVDMNEQGLTFLVGEELIADDFIQAVEENGMGV
ncbi:MAG: ABC transporter substrate-binding protein, partial [Merismopedia sp. SIO2A8]|nr:ABC transporter substrate-binding protein [Merismopedia sp. SIO2A8]